LQINLLTYQRYFASDGLALMHHLCRYENMEQEEADRLRSMEIQSIRGGLGSPARSQSAEAGFGKLAGKMAKKFGKKAGVDFYEGQRWLNVFNR
jgi:hypothetical protein